MKKTILALAVIVAAFAFAQDKPQAIDKKDLPKTAVATFCGADGKTEMEKPSVGYRFKGKSYYFCDKAAIDAFLKDPIGFLPPALPRPMTEFAIADTTGKVWNAESMKDKVVLIDFWATWCGPCKQMMPALDKVAAKYKDSPFALLSVSVDAKKPDFDKFIKGHKFPNPVLHDSAKTFEKWGVKSIPATFLVKNGQVIGQWTGIQTEKTLSAAIDAAMNRE